MPDAHVHATPAGAAAEADHPHEHPPGLAHHFESYAQQKEASTFGMWLFLATEIMFFGGLFLAYTIYRGAYHRAFELASHELDVLLGTVNTAILIGSSLTMAMAVHSAQLGRRKAIVWFLIATMILGGAFLGIKSVEYGHKAHEHLFPGPTFEFAAAPEHAGAAQIFFSLYFAMTGLHALHMIVGIGIMFWLIPQAWKGRFTPQNHNYVEGFGLYWHFVDIVWIFLFPLLYLLGRHA